MKKKILIVEDEYPLLAAIQESLIDEGYQVITANNGENGLNRALVDKPDLILLDIYMPEMSGFDMLKSLRKKIWGKKVPVIIFSNAEPDGGVILDITKTEPAYFLQKSQISIETVLNKIKEVIGEAE